MPAFEARTAVTAVLLLVALGAVAAPAAAGGGDTDGGVGVGVEVGVADGDGLNSTVDASAEAEAAGRGGGGSVDCEGQPTHHECDKRGEVDGGAASVDYDGRTYSDDDDRRFGGGDEVTVRAAGERRTVEFDCAFDTGPSRDDCTFDDTSRNGPPAGR